MKTQRGSATIEILIAFAIMIIILSGVMAVAFGGQTAGLDINLTGGGLSAMQTFFGDSVASSSEDWLGFTSKDLPGFYDLSRTVENTSPCVKLIDSDTQWNTTGSRTPSVGIVGLVVNVPEALKFGGDCDPFPPDEWKNPKTVDIPSGILKGAKANDIDVKNNYIYVTADQNAKNKPDLFIYKFNPTTKAISFVSELDIYPADKEGLTGVDVAGNYAFVITASTTAQLQVVDVSNPLAPAVVVAAKRQLKNVDPAGDVPQGRSIYYYNNHLYIGTGETATAEFHVFDVTTPTNPTEIGNGLNLFTNVNDIVVSGNYAYLATSDNSSELCIINISDPTNTTLFRDCETTGLYYDTAGDQDAGGVFISGDKAYLSLSRGNSDVESLADLYVLNVTNPASITFLGSKNLGINKNTDSAGVVVQWPLAFVGLDDPNTGLQIWNISNPDDIVLPSDCPPKNFAENTTGMDKNNKFIFTSNVSSKEITIIYDDTTTTCS